MNDDFHQSGHDQYLVLIHVPQRGYQLHLHNLDDTSREDRARIDAIINRLSNHLRSEFALDNMSHSKIDFSLRDEDLISVYASKISNKSFDERGRTGIVFGVYFMSEVESFDTSSYQKIHECVSPYLNKMEKEHELFSQRAPNESNVEPLVRQFYEFSKTVFEQEVLSIVRRLPSTDAYSASEGSSHTPSIEEDSDVDRVDGLQESEEVQPISIDEAVNGTDFHKEAEEGSASSMWADFKRWLFGS